MKKNLGGVWRFSLENVSHGFFADDIWSKDYDDSQWRRVSVPHDWDGDNFLGERRTADGTDELVEDSGWYRCHFAADGTMGQKRVFVEFGGVSKHCKAWCNGYYLGRHENSLMPFRFDVTDALKGNAQDVVLALKVEQGKASGARWYTGAGIGRPVNIRYVGDCYFEEAGVIFDGDYSGLFSVRVNLLRDDINVLPNAKEKHVAVRFTLSDSDGLVLFRGIKNVDLKNGEGRLVSFKGLLQNVRCWSPAYPELYHLHVELICDNSSEPSDVYDSPVGFRSFVFDSAKAESRNSRSDVHIPMLAS